MWHRNASSRGSNSATRSSRSGRATCRAALSLALFHSLRPELSLATNDRVSRKKTRVLRKGRKLQIFSCARFDPRSGTTKRRAVAHRLARRSERPSRRPTTTISTSVSLGTGSSSRRKRPPERTAQYLEPGDPRPHAHENPNRTSRERLPNPSPLAAARPASARRRGGPAILGDDKVHCLHADRTAQARAEPGKHAQGFK